MFLFQTHYKKIVQKDLILLDPHLKGNVLPSIKRVVLSCGGEDIDEEITLSYILTLYSITKKRPYLALKKTKGRFSEEIIVGGKNTLQGHLMHSFLDRLFLECFSNIKYFKGTRPPVCSTTYNFAIDDIFLFDELMTIYPYLENVEFLNCQVDFNNSTNYRLILLAQSMLFCFE